MSVFKKVINVALQFWERVSKSPFSEYSITWKGGHKKDYSVYVLRSVHKPGQPLKAKPSHFLEFNFIAHLPSNVLELVCTQGGSTGMPTRDSWSLTRPLCRWRSRRSSSAVHCVYYSSPPSSDNITLDTGCRWRCAFASSMAVRYLFSPGIYLHGNVA